MSSGMSYREVGSNAAAIINGYDNTLNNEQENEDLSSLSTVLLQKKLKKINEQMVYFRAENRLLHNYLLWYEKRILPTQDKRNSGNSTVLHNVKPFSQQTLRSRIKPALSIEKKREIAETTFKVLVAYNQKYGLDITQYVDECINTIETGNDTIVHVELELMTLKKFVEKVNAEIKATQKKFTAEELFEFFRDRIRHLEALDERKRQKTVRLRFHIDGVEKSIRKVHQIVDTVTAVDFEQLKIDIDKQLKEMQTKNRMLVFYKRQQSEANVKLNAKKPQLFHELRALTSVRKETDHRIQLLKHYQDVKQRMQDDIRQYEKSNEPLREMTVSYRVPSILAYVDLKWQQIHLHRQKQAWERKVQIVEHELHLRETATARFPEEVVHPWKYLQNPSSVLFYHRYQTTLNQTDEGHPTAEKRTLKNSLPRIKNQSTIHVGSSMS